MPPFTQITDFSKLISFSKNKDSCKNVAKLLGIVSG